MRQTSSPTSPVPTSELPASSTTSIAMPSAGPPSEHALIGPTGVGERKHAPTSVPPEQLMIGTRDPPTFSDSQRYGSGFHGSPVVTKVRSDERSEAGLPWGSRARARVGERPSDVTRSCSTMRQRRSGVGPVGGALHEHDRAAERADADDRPRPHDPAHVGREMHDVALVHVGLVGGLARDRDEEAALDVQDALRLAGRARGVGQEVRGSPSRPRAGAAAPGRPSSSTRRRARPELRTPARESPPRGSRASARSGRGASTPAA